MLQAASAANRAMARIRIVRIDRLDGAAQPRRKFSSRGPGHRLNVRVVLRSILVLSALAGLPTPAAAERAIVVSELGASMPFSESELASALRVRLPSAGATVRLAVTASGDGVVVAARGGSRTVALHGRTGADAARLVALAAIDLVLDDLATAPVVATAAAAPPPQRPAIGFVGSAAQWSGVLAGATLDVALPRGDWFAAIDVGGATLVGGGLHLSGGVVRLGGGARVGWFELRAGATLVPLVVDDGEGDRTVLAGAGSSVRLRVPLGGGVAAVAAAGGDVFATRTQYVLAGRMIATPLVSPWLGAGIEVVP